ncbi:hypothetical protein [Chelatococcus asaccharovorans]|uniref:hypothetical protein n=1 Tax=Chelatococcus asaccharovorans TaxID=28210 RepID=UPI00224C72AD|nr:hypothetical protein [Chelatococcus asaccharovorans]CAH1671903.1 hypothetical protein CHELA17_61304 [Chelatococcus asaccharovorans]CAH1676690.1 hypothetical protein CHELA40_14317 [Chelatococcus asaccharovorans]
MPEFARSPSDASLSPYTPVIPSRAAIGAALSAPDRRKRSVHALRRRAELLKGLQRASLAHLADLYAHCTTPYPEVVEPRGERVGFDWRHLLRETVPIASAAALCAEC